MILLAALVIMAVAAVVAPFLSRALGRSVGYVLAGVFLTVLGLILSLAPEALDRAVLLDLPWLPSIDVGLRLRLDGLSLLFVTLVLGVGALIMSYSARYLSADHDHGRLFGLLTAFATAMLGLVLSSDIVLLLVFWELTTLCSFFLIGGRGLVGARPAIRALIVTGGGGLALLAAVAMMAIVVGSTDLSTVIEQRALIQTSPLGPWIGGLLIVAAFTKSAQVPFHFWLPDAMVAITPVSAYLHAATLVKAGIYLLLRFSPIYAGATGWTVVLIGTGLTTALVGAVLALKQYDLKALLAYSTVSQLGWIVALIGVGTNAGLAVAALHTFAHAGFKATLFMLVGIIDREAGSRDIRQLSGLYRVMPVTAVLTGLAALSMAGVPPFLGFVSKEEAYKAWLELPGPLGGVVVGVAVISAAITFAYGFRLLYGAFGGPTRQKDLYEPSWLFLAPAAVPAALGLLLGLFVNALNPLINRTVEDTLRQQGDADLALWHGFTPALYLSLVTFALGYLLFRYRDPIDARLQRRTLGFTGAGVLERCYSAAIAFGDIVGRPTRSGALSAHLVHPVWVLVALGGAGLLLASPAGPLEPGGTRPADWGIVALIAIAVVAMCLVRSRLAAVALLGVVGFAIGVWFILLGAPDLALTQVLVEILTVIVAVLVLRRLPRAFAASGRARTVAAAVVAGFAGVAAFVGTLALTGRREPSPAGDFLLAEGPELSGGSNVVNTILVDFRGLDTLGEATVLAVAALGLLALLRSNRPPASPSVTAEPTDPLARGSAELRIGNATVFRITARLLFGAVLALSLYLLLRGHNDPGGGFIAALVGGVAVALRQLPHPEGIRTRIRAVPLLAAGLLVSVCSGLLGYLDGSFLRPLRDKLVVGGVELSLTTSLIFDVGVYLCVLGLVVAAVDRLNRGRVAPAASDDPDSDGADSDGAEPNGSGAGADRGSAGADRESAGASHGSAEPNRETTSEVTS